jgi:hypothetical protein
MAFSSIPCVQAVYTERAIEIEARLYTLCTFKMPAYPSSIYGVTEETPAQTRQLSRSSKFLLALASTVILGFGPRREPWPNFFVRSKTVYVFGKRGVPFSGRRGWSF